MNTDRRRDERPSCFCMVQISGYLGFERLGFVRFREYRPGTFSPVPRLFPLLGVHFHPFPTIRVLGYSLPPSELSGLGVGAISSGITGRLSILALYPSIHSGTWAAIRAACSAFLSRP